MNHINKTTATTTTTGTVIDEMFPDGSGVYMMDLDEPSAAASSFALDLPSSDKIVHTDFYNRFDDLFDEDDLS